MAVAAVVYVVVSGPSFPTLWTSPSHFDPDAWCPWPLLRLHRELTPVPVHLLWKEEGAVEGPGHQEGRSIEEESEDDIEAPNLFRRSYVSRIFSFTTSS
jgi:hypothetical protein